MNKLNFGIEAPTAIRNLLIGSFASLFVFIGSIIFVAINAFVTIFEIAILLVFLGTLTISSLLFISSKYSKMSNRDQLLDRINLNGEETILDIGCGRGLFTVGAAAKMTTGKVYGIDIWNSEDLSANSETSIMKNIKEYVTYFRGKKCDVIYESIAKGIFPISRNLIIKKNVA
jgi:SAM-dependent methyltransferase